ncbi:MAG: methionyl-tRNA formyltransferase [Dehalococcoidia bacterium]|nr:MAG: methionyl-tRNA formyltransferase [Dehalococcoidia bacterium]
MRIVFMGTPEFGVPVLQLLVLNGYHVVSVYTQPDKPVGRGQKLIPTPVKREALKLGLPVLQPDNLKNVDVAAELVDFKADFIIVAAYGQILPKMVLDTPVLGCVNIHPSLLPRYRGASPIHSAILDAAEFTGVSIMLMNEGLDTGPVLTRAQIPIADNDTAASLRLKLSLIAANLLQDVLPDFKKGQIIPRIQDESRATYSGMITRKSGEIDWHMPADFIWRQARAFHPWPGCYTHWRGKRVKVVEAIPVIDERDAIEGQVLATTDGGFAIRTGTGTLKILTLQLEGKREMTASEFLRGQRQLIDDVLPN